ncbi:MAG TPA: phosphoadenosine phosphosulfate sulfotransferase [Methylophaga aminisulfidivorans]|nr:phosphoadenosine phosphosulfate sulfotransferase [Methylophaga sp.]HEC74299.1 phosphoadenosine phosphosulfate sulfotransferase [Methylophaga aminisulfidivorans]
MNNPKFEAAITRIEELFMDGIPIAVSTSSGKDSSVLMDITLHAALRAKSKGIFPRILATNSDTGVENPEISMHVLKDSQRLLKFADKHGLDLDFQIARPNLNDEWAVGIFSGRCLPSFPTTNSDCTTDLKIKPMKRLRKKMLNDVAGKSGKEVVTLVGTRYSESVARGKKMEKRKETHLSPMRNKDGDLVFAAIADFETDDVWEWIGYVRSGLIESYSDFEDLTRIYADSGASGCAVISDSITESLKSQRGNSCTARSGCITCLRVGKTDKSLENMIQSDREKYGYMVNANRLRNFMFKTQWDYSRRNWVGRTLTDDGCLKIRPDTYSPEMCLDLLRYALTIDAEEQEAAYAAGLSLPRFQLISFEGLIAIDALWSLQGMHRPFQAIVEYKDIFENGVRYPVPDIDYVKRTPMPKTKYFKVEGDAYSQGVFDGLRMIEMEFFDPSHCMGVRTLKNGKVVMDVETESSFDVDFEGAVLAIDFEYDRMMDIRSDTTLSRGYTRGYKWWVSMGVVSLSPQQLSLHDAILRRTVVKEGLGLVGPGIDVEELLSRSFYPEKIDSKTAEIINVIPMQLDMFEAA